MKNNFLSLVTKMPQNTGGGNSQTKRATFALPLRYLCAMLLALFMGVGNMWAADLEETILVSSNFASATERKYTGNVACAITGEDCPAPFTELYMYKSSNCDVAVNSETGGGSRKVSGKLQAYLNNTSKKWSWVRSSNLATTAPEVLHIKAVMLFDKTLAGSAGNTMCIAVGNGFEDGTQAYPAATNVVAGFSFSGGNTKINKYNAYGTAISGSKEFSNNTEFTLDWYINNSASKISYTDPNGTSHELAAGCFDIWVDKVLFCDAVDKATNGVSGTTMQNLYIGSNGSSTKKHEFVLSSINIYSLSAAAGGGCTTNPTAPTAFAKTEVTATTATFSITDGADAASYDLYYAAGSPTAPTSGTTATTNVTTKTPTIEDLTGGTSYKIWVRSVCDDDHKSAWLALGDGGSFTTLADPEATFNDGMYVLEGSVLDLSSLFSQVGSGSVTYSITDPGETGATLAGSSFSATTAGTATVQAVLESAGGYAGATKTAKVRVVAAPTHLIENRMAVSGNWDSYILTNNAHISGLVTITPSEGKTLIKSGKESASGGRTPGITSNSSATLVEGDYIYIQFTIESGYELTLSEISVPVFKIANSSGNYVARISDASNSIESDVLTLSQNGTGNPFNGYDFSSSPKLSGTVTLKLFAYGWSDGYRMESPVYIDGTISEVDVTAPTFVSSVPANSATGVDVSGTIVLTFSENIASVDDSKFSLSNATIGTVAIDGTDATKVNVPYTDAVNEATVTLSVDAEAVADAAGNKSAALSDIAFTIAASGVCVKPDAPEDLDVEVKTNNYAKFIWDNGTAGANGYEIALTSEAVGAAGKFDWKDEDDAIYEATSLTPETEYTFKVKYKGTVDDCYSDEVTTTFTTYAACTELVPETSGDSPSAIGDEIRLQGGSTGGKMYVADNKAGKTLAESFTYTANGISLNTGGQDSLRVELSSLMKVGTVISAEIYNANNDKVRGLLLQNMSKTTKATWTTTMVGTHYETYTVVAGDGLAGSNKFLLARSETAALKSLSVSNCGDAVYEVTFDMKNHGSQVAKQVLTAGAKVTEPAEPEAAGYIFGGWYKETTLENAWNFLTDVVPSNNITLYAKWTADPCPDSEKKSIVKAVMTSTSTATVTGYNDNEYAGGYIINNLADGDNAFAYDFGEGSVTGYKLKGSGSAIFATLAKGGFEAGDKVVFAVTKKAGDNKLAVYAAKDKNNVLKLAEIDVADAGIYEYKLKAADIAAIEAAGADYKSIGSYRGDYNPFIYSVELKGCRSWAVMHTLTFKNIDGTATIAAEPLEEGAYASTVAPTAPKIAMKRFKGWSESKGGSTVDLTSYTITEDKILYAVYEDIVCPTTGTVYKFQLKTDLTDGKIFTSAPGELTLNTTDHLSSMVNGEVTVNLASDKNTNRVQFYDGKAIGFANGDGASITLTLDCALATGDEIRFINYAGSGNKMNLSDGAHSLELNGNNAETVQKITVNSDWNGADELTLTRGGNTPKLTYFEIYRPAKYDVSFNMMGHGSAIADLEDVVEGSKITAPSPAPTDVDYRFAGWYKENTLENEWKFDVDVVETNTTLYAKWLDKSDATLKSLKYGETDIVLVVDQDTYDITLPSLTSSVPALTAETNNPNATKLIANGTFDGAGNATSTVTVTPEVGADKVYTVNFSRGVALEQATVTASTEWDWSAAGVSAEIKESNTPGLSGNDVVIANVPGVKNDADFNSQALKASGTNAIRTTYFQGKELNIKTDKEGMLIVDFGGTNGNARVLKVYDNADNEIAAWNYNSETRQVQQVVVPAGGVTLKAFEGASGNNARIYNLKFYALAYTRDDDWMAPGELGTVCYPEGLVAVGAEMYKMAGVDDNNKFVFDEVSVLDPGKPYLFVAQSNVLKFYATTATAAGAAGTNNGMVGTFESIDLDYTDAHATKWYYFSGKKFYSVSKRTSDLNVPANRAYVDMNTPVIAGAPKHGVRRITFDVQGTNIATGVENAAATDKPAKMLINGQLFILRGEKMYDAKGQLVK